MAKAAKVKIRVSTQPVVVMEAEVARKIRQHARGSMKAEVCGVLIGSTEHERMTVEACIQGNNAAQGGAHVTFTQDTWEHIYKIKDKEYPDQKIVGWYHSHPGFGVFLSEHDLFIQQNFFSNPQQVAWVYDPHTDEEGCFGWVGDKIEKLTAIRVGYSQSIDVSASGSSNSSDYEDEEAGLGSMVKVGNERQPGEPAWVRWAFMALGYMVAMALGFVLGYLLPQWQLDRQAKALAEQATLGQQIAQHPVEACQEILQHLAPSLLAPVAPGAPMPQAAPAPQVQGAPATPQAKAPQSSPQEKARAQKGNNGKH
ncbi:MAG TPA: Mov34/MPN/PAD-1 family protein [Candidatus Angelobacter sp.]|nr:Mov34/MPN/PAD-1 family protein [Candidatus Angelobacter sp.]